MLLAAAALAVLIGAVHSVLGEKYILMRLFRRPLPPLFGNDDFTRRTLRFAWHITTVAWWGFAVILCSLASHSLSQHRVLVIIGGTFAVTATIAFAGSRGRHLSWIVFSTIAVLCFIAGNAAATMPH